MLSFLLTLAVGLAFGLIGYRFRVPAGTMLFPLFGVALMNILFDAAYMPPEARIFAQMICGTVVGSMISRESLRELPRISRAVCMLMAGYVVLAFSMGFLINRISTLDLATSLLMCAPGGASDIALITADYGGDTPTVLTMQIVRLITGLGLIPLIPMFLTRRLIDAECPDHSPGCMPSRPAPRVDRGPHRLRDTALSGLCGIVCGLFGRWTGIPAGTIVFSLIGTLAFKIIFGIGCRSVFLRRGGMGLNGCYIGSTICLADVLTAQKLIIPALVLIAGYLAYCLIMGMMMHRALGIELRECLLITSPAGATEMSLIAADMGIDCANIALIQMFRVVLVLLIFPQLISLALLAFA
ncbi:MAG: AbrB family transcriptional regulator [Mailhella sp.]|nr:AbrB family transcriptional regulator [Mailhella sp.]